MNRNIVCLGRRCYAIVALILSALLIIGNPVPAHAGALGPTVQKNQLGTLTEGLNLIECGEGSDRYFSFSPEEDGSYLITSYSPYGTDVVGAVYNLEDNGDTVTGYGILGADDDSSMNPNNGMDFSVVTKQLVAGKNYLMNVHFYDDPASMRIKIEKIDESRHYYYYQTRTINEGDEDGHIVNLEDGICIICYEETDGTSVVESHEYAEGDDVCRVCGYSGESGGSDTISPEDVKGIRTGANTVSGGDWLSFSPSQSASYLFYSVSAMGTDPAITIYESDETSDGEYILGDHILTDDDYCINSQNPADFGSTVYDMEAGKTYLMHISEASDKSSSFIVNAVNISGRHTTHFTHYTISFDTSEQEHLIEMTGGECIICGLEMDDQTISGSHSFSDNTNVTCRYYSRKYHQVEERSSCESCGYEKVLSSEMEAHDFVECDDISVCTGCALEIENASYLDVETISGNGSTNVIQDQEGDYYYHFTPSQTGTYIIEVTGAESYISGTLYDYDSRRNARYGKLSSPTYTGQDQNGREIGFAASYMLSQGQDYLLKLTSYEAENLTIKIAKSQPGTHLCVFNANTTKKTAFSQTKHMVKEEASCIALDCDSVYEKESYLANHAFDEDGWCDCGYMEGDYISYHEHSWDEGSITVEPTCSRRGVKTYCCTDDDCDSVKTEPVSAAGHSWAATYTVDEEATCSYEGSKSIHCRNCDAVKDVISIAKKSHTVKRVPAAAATCTKSGLTEGSICSVCEEVLTEQEEVEPLGHDFRDSAVITEAGCTTTGKKLLSCSRCDATEERIIEAAGHSWYDTYTIDEEATCTSTGMKSIHCRNCDARTATSTIPRKAHQAVTDPPMQVTCTDAGLTEGSHCSVCHQVLKAQEVIPATGHEWEEAVGAFPSCTSTGIRYFRCSNNGCNELRKEIVPATDHSWNTTYTVDQEATCTEAGEKSIHCSRCSERKDIKTIPATGHSWVETGITKNATCTEKGEKAFQCSSCHETKTEEIPAAGHSWNSTYTVEKEATCSSEGLKAIHCSKCTERKNVTVIAKKAHPSVTDLKVDETCTKEGLSEGSHCSVCGTVLTKQEVIPAKGHSWVETGITKNPSCTEKGEKAFQCSSCHETKTEAIPETGHSWNSTYTVEKEATCSSEGLKAIHCSKCGERKNITVIAKKAHTPVTDPEVLETCTETGLTEGSHCSVCNEVITAQVVIPAAGHSWSREYTVDRESTCTKEGEKSIHCIACDARKDITSVALKAHEAVSDAGREPSCTETGLTEGSHCSICGTVIHAQEEIPALGHSYVDQNNGTVPSCTTGGTRNLKCSICGHETTETIPVSGHSWESTYTIDVEATCLGFGYRSIHCSRCNETTSGRIILPTGHSWNSEYTVDQEATCAKTGVKSIHCANCDSTKNQETTPMTEHSWDEGTVIKEAGCTDRGEVKYVCTVCSKEIREITAETGHSWKDTYTVDKKASCQEEGMKSIHCSNCDAVKDQESIPMAGHSYGEGTEIRKATCTEKGEKTFICSVCGNEKKEEIPAAGHDWNISYTVDKNASCQEEGMKSIHCSNCDAVKDQVAIPVTEHSYGTGTVTKKATCTAKGEKTYTCSICGNEKKEVIPAAGHSWNTSYTVDKKATCQEEGMKSIHCADCDAVKDQTVVPVTGHSYGTGTVTKKATCTVKGEKTYTCSICSAVKKEEIPAAGHDWNTSYTVDKEATCTEAGSKSIHCRNCDAVKDQTAIEAAGHSFGKWTVSREATCTEAGKKLRKCSCGKSESAVIEALGHSWSSTYTVDKKPTCTKAGSKSKHCTRCDAAGTAVTIAALGHSWESTYTVDKKATYAEAGSKSIHCSVCDVKKSGSTVTIAKLVPEKTSIKSLTAASKAFTVKWEKKSYSGYQIRYSTSSSMSSAKTVTVSNASTVSKKITSLKAKKKYYVQVRTYKTYDGKKYYSSWCTKKSVTTK